MSYYNPESENLSDELLSFVNGSSGKALFVFVLEHRLSAIIYNEEIYKKSGVALGDFAFVKIRKQRDTQNYAVRHVVESAVKASPSSSIKEMMLIHGNPVLKIVANQNRNGTFSNDFIGPITDPSRCCAGVSMKDDLLVQVQVKRIRQSNCYEFVIIKRLGYAEKKQPSIGLIRKSNGFTVGVWSHDYEQELLIFSRDLEMESYLGHWIQFDKVNIGEDGTLRIDPESVTKLDWKLANMRRSLDNNVEFELRCIGKDIEIDRHPVLIISGGGKAIDIQNVFHQMQNLNFEFPQMLWLRESTHASCPWQLSTNNPSLYPSAYQRSPSSSLLDSSTSSKKGIIMSQVEDRCYVYCPQFKRNLLMKWEAVKGKKEATLTGKWIEFSKLETMADDRTRIRKATIIDEIFPTRLNPKNKNIDIKVTCTAEEKMRYLDGSRIFSSEEFIDFIVDIYSVIPRDAQLPFSAWVSQMPKCQLRWQISKEGASNQSKLITTSPDQVWDLDCSSPSLEWRVSPKSSNSSPTSATAPRSPTPQTMRDVEFLKMMEDEAGGIYSDDEDDNHQMKDAIKQQEAKEINASPVKEVDIPVEEVLDQKIIEEVLNLSEQLTIEEILIEQQILEETVKKQKEKKKIPIVPSSPYKDMTLKELGVTMLGNSEFCTFFEEFDRRLYHAFANKILNG